MGRHTKANVCAACLLLAMAAAPVQAGMAWRSVPEIVVHTEEAGGHGHGGGRAGFYLREGEGAVLSFWKPTLEQLSLPPVKPDGKATVRPTGVDSYHLLMATRSSEAGEEVALRYQYMRGKPSGESPQRLLDAPKKALDIVPEPLPREHWRYETSARAAFRVLFNGAPLAEQPVRLVTTNGSLAESITDSSGRIQFTLPEDFTHVAPGRQANAPAEFIISTVHSVGGNKHVTTLSAEYHASPDHWQSSLGGVIALVAGFVGGMALWRRLPAEGASV